LQAKQRLIYIFISTLLLVTFMTIGYLMYISSFVKPKIDFTGKVTEISSKDYQRILENKQVPQDTGIENFKHINLALKVNNPIGLSLINNVKIKRNQLQEYFKGIDKVQVLSGGYFEHGNGREFTENIEINSKGLSETQLKDLLQDFRVVVTWQGIWHSDNKTVLYLRDYIE
jgi:hypothetical protein